MDSILTSVKKIIWIQKLISFMYYVTQINRVHMMNKYLPMYLITLHSKVASIIPNNDRSSDRSPFSGLIKYLIHVPIKSECFFSNNSVQLQIFKSVFKSFQLDQFGICSNHLLHPHDHYILETPLMLQHTSAPVFP